MGRLRGHIAAALVNVANRTAVSDPQLHLLPAPAVNANGPSSARGRGLALARPVLAHEHVNVVGDLSELGPGLALPRLERAQALVHQPEFRAVRGLLVLHLPTRQESVEAWHQELADGEGEDGVFNRGFMRAKKGRSLLLGHWSLGRHRDGAMHCGRCEAVGRSSFGCASHSVLSLSCNCLSWLRTTTGERVSWYSAFNSSRRGSQKSMLQSSHDVGMGSGNGSYSPQRYGDSDEKAMMLLQIANCVSESQEPSLHAATRSSRSAQYGCSGSGSRQPRVDSSAPSPANHDIRIIPRTPERGLTVAGQKGASHQSRGRPAVHCRAELSCTPRVTTVPMPRGDRGMVCVAGRTGGPEPSTPSRGHARRRRTSRAPRPRPGQAPSRTGGRGGAPVVPWIHRRDAPCER